MAKRSWLPIALSVVGLGGLLASWACFPPIPLVGGTYVNPVVVAPDTTYFSPSPAATSPPPARLFGDLTPAFGRTYAYRTTGVAAGRLLVAVTAVDGDKVSFTSNSAPDGASPPPAQEGSATRTNGVFWVFADRPSPVEKPIDDYPTELVSVPVGEGQAAKVAAGADTYWFVDGIIVKAVTAAGTTELEQLR